MGIDTTSQMQIINEAYSILKDQEKRTRYNVEYLRFNSVYRTPKENTTKTADSSRPFENSETYNYDIYDERVKQDVKNAREYAKQIVDEFMSSLKKEAKIATKGAWESMIPYIISMLILILLGILFGYYNT